MVSMVAGRGRNDRVQLYFVGKQLPTTWDLYPDPGWEDAGEFQPQPSGINTPEGPEIMATPQDLAVTQLGITGSNGPGDPKTGYGNAGRSQLFALYPTFANPDVSEFWTTSKHNEVQNSYWEPWNKLALVSDSAALLTSSQIDKAGHIAVWAVGAFGVDDRGRGTPVGLQWTTNVGAQYPSDPITSGFEAFDHGGNQLFGGLTSALDNDGTLHLWALLADAEHAEDAVYTISTLTMDAHGWAPDWTTFGAAAKTCVGSLFAARDGDGRIYLWADVIDAKGDTSWKFIQSTNASATEWSGWTSFSPPPSDSPFRDSSVIDDGGSRSDWLSAAILPDGRLQAYARGVNEHPVWARTQSAPGSLHWGDWTALLTLTDL